MNQGIPVLPLTMLLTGAVAAQRFITPAGTQAGAGANTIGIARVAGIAGDRIPYDALGTAPVQSGAAFALGATLQSDANGKAITWATGAKVGIALEAAGAADVFPEAFLVPNAA